MKKKIVMLGVAGSLSLSSLAGSLPLFAQEAELFDSGEALVDETAGEEEFAGEAAGYALDASDQAAGYANEGVQVCSSIGDLTGKLSLAEQAGYTGPKQFQLLTSNTSMSYAFPVNVPAGCSVDFGANTINLSGTNGITLANGASIENGTINYAGGKGSAGIAVAANAKNVGITNISLTASNWANALLIPGGSQVSVYGKSLSSYEHAIVMENSSTSAQGAELYLDSVAVTSDGYSALYKDSSISGGTITITGSSRLVSMGGGFSASSIDPTVYIDNYSDASRKTDLTISGSTEVRGMTAVEAKSANISVLGSSVTLRSTAPSTYQPEYIPSASHSTTYGYALALSNNATSSSTSSSMVQSTGEIYIQGGTFVGGVGIIQAGSYAKDPSAAWPASMTIAGGTFHNLKQSQVNTDIVPFLQSGLSLNQVTGQVVNGNGSVQQPASNGTLISENGVIRFKYKNGQYAVNSWETVKDHKYYFNANGNAVQGMQILDGQIYYFSNDCILQTGWQKIGNDYYFFGWGGPMVTGLQTIENKTYYFGTNGVMQTGFVTIDGRLYLFEKDGARQDKVGWRTVDGNKYYFSADHSILTGKQVIKDKTYLFSAQGVMQTGWQKEGSETYYYTNSGAMATGLMTIEKNRYYFNAQGIMQTGMVKTNTDMIYQFDSKGAMVLNTGWKDINGKRYYFGSNNAAYTGTQTIDGKMYRFDDNGVLKTEVETGWFEKDGIWYFNNPDGEALTGLQKLDYVDGESYYYFDKYGRMQTGWEQIEGPAGKGWYFFDESGKLKTNWLKLDNQWFYLGKEGLMQTGWAEENGKTYYLVPGEGNMLASQWMELEGNWYYLDSAGERAVGWKYIKTSNQRWADKGWFYFGEDGVMWKNTITPDGFVLGSSGEWFH